MLTFEKVLKVFQAYLDDDPLYEVVQTSHGYTLMAWEPHRNDWYCAKHQGKILTKQQIYEEVWGEEYFYDDSNIMAIISRLRKKLEVNPSSPKYIQTVKGIGYRFNKEV